MSGAYEFGLLPHGFLCAVLPELESASVETNDLQTSVDQKEIEWVFERQRGERIVICGCRFHHRPNVNTIS